MYWYLWIDPAHFLLVPRLAWQAGLKKTEVKLELLTDNDMLVIVEKGIRGGICEAVYRHVKANNKCMNDYDKNIESSYLEYLMQIICIDGKCVKNYL